MSWSERYIIQGHEEWRKSRHCSWWPRAQSKRREVTVTHFVHLMWMPAPTWPSPPGTEPSVQAVMSLWSREDRWEVAMVLSREGGSLREHGEESWIEMV